ncbi:hypothetical protein [Natronoarchaeum rubrum]|uniref:hypothetical protein n=1 Tax=Natronoarchaeum rubrum TaxID=755311 RepID=UPI00211158DC|nr:hypothetical protein [Natronoarchaeum rubrum]
MSDVDPLAPFVDRAAEADDYAMEYEAAINGDGLTIFAVDSLDEQWITCDTVAEIRR